MADSAFLSRLPVRGAVFQSTGINDAFKVPLLDAEGKIHFSLLSNSSTIYEAENTAHRLAQTAATPGDFCIQEDNNSIYFLKTAPPTIENNWIRLSTVEDSEQDFDSPNFTGIPTAPTAPPETSTTQLATTEFVHSLAGDLIPSQDEAIGEIGESFKYAREDHKHPTDISRAPLNSPAFTGTPTAPTPDYADNSTRAATTAFVKSQSLDQFTPARGNINVNNWRITSLGAPISDKDAVPKGYVDALQSGLTVRTPVRVATTTNTGNISLAGNVNSIDGISLTTGDRVLVKNQINPSQNGIYVVTLGAPWQRAADADSSVEMKNGVYVFVLEGNINKDTAWVLITTGNIVLNVTPLNFVYFTNQTANQIVAGTGLTRDLNVLSIDSDIVATKTDLSTKEDNILAGEEGEYWRGDKTWQPLDKTAVGLENVDNTADVDKPVSDATKVALDAKFNLVSVVEALGSKYKGFYDNGTDYAIGDVVQYEGGLYRRLLPENPGYPPTDSTYWVIWNLNDKLVEKQDALVSGTNIKTVGGISLLGTGDIDIVSEVNIATTQNDIVEASATVNENGINISLASKYNTAMADSVSSVAVGGAAAQLASVWKNKNIVQVLDTILFPDVAPTYLPPTAGLSATTSSATREVGEQITQSLTLTYTKNDAGVPTTPTFQRIGEGAGTVSETISLVENTLSDLPAQYDYANPNNPNKSFVYSVSENFVVLAGNTNWTSNISYAAGLRKKNNKGVEDTRTAAVRSTTAPQANGSFSGVTVPGISGIYPYYWGVSSTPPTLESIAEAIFTEVGASRILSSANGNVSILFNGEGQYIWFAHAAIYTTKTKWYVTDLNSGNIPGGFIAAPQLANVSSKNLRWSNVSFKIYVSLGASNTNVAPIQFRNT